MPSAAPRATKRSTRSPSTRSPSTRSPSTLKDPEREARCGSNAKPAGRSHREARRRRASAHRDPHALRGGRGRAARAARGEGGGAARADRGPHAGEARGGRGPEGRDGAEGGHGRALSVVHQTAVDEINRAAPNASPQERADAAMAVASFALLGKHQNDNLASVDAGRTSMMKYLRELTARRGRRASTASPRTPPRARAHLERLLRRRDRGPGVSHRLLRRGRLRVVGQPLEASSRCGRGRLPRDRRARGLQGRRQHPRRLRRVDVRRLRGRPHEASARPRRRRRDPLMVVGLIAKDGAATKPTGLSPTATPSRRRRPAAVRADRDSARRRTARSIEYAPRGERPRRCGVQLAQKVWNR